MSVKSYPNERDCEHGQLRRSCPACAADAEYAALEARHNALVEAVEWMLECDSCPLKNTTEAEKHGFAALWATRRAARAEVDRLLEEK